jgi:anaerobic glycerol-3-phosphate dehydrogenase
MGVRAEELAKKFEESCREFATAVEGLSDADWKKVTHLGSIRATTGTK